MHVYVCFLASMLYVHVCLFRSRLCHALCLLWACACRSFKATCLCGHICPSCGSFGCYHLCDTPPRCWCAWYTRFSAPCDVYMLALLALCHPFGFLCFFSSLHSCLHVYAWVYVSSILHSNGPIDTQSKPTYILLGHLFSCALHACLPLYLYIYIYLLLVCLLACFPSYLFLCLFASLFLFLLHVHAWSIDAWSKGATS